LKAYKVRPASNELPYKWETGTQNHEGIAGLFGALEYFEWIGKEFAAPQGDSLRDMYTGRKLTFKQALTLTRAYEFELSRALIEAISSVPGTQIYGLTDLKRLEERVPTVSFTLKGKDPRKVAEELAAAGIYVWDGNYYALAVTERLGLEDKGGMVRVDAVHYNSLEEIERFRVALQKISAA
jgi:selenocysteine lyase/cysteine desulfurase